MQMHLQLEATVLLKTPFIEWETEKLYLVASLTHEEHIQQKICPGPGYLPMNLLKFSSCE